MNIVNIAGPTTFLVLQQARIINANLHNYICKNIGI